MAQQGNQMRVRACKRLLGSFLHHLVKLILLAKDTIYSESVMPRRYADIEAEFCDNSWEQNKKKIDHVTPGDKMAHTLAHN
jgi:hypothetical protein